MVWDWSHSPEAYATLRENMQWLIESGLAHFSDAPTLQNLADMEFCVESWAECKLNAEGKQCNVETFDVAFMRGLELFRMGGDAFLDSWWDMVSDIRLCTNGGHYAYVCPFGCHKLPFDPISWNVVAKFVWKGNNVTQSINTDSPDIESVKLLLSDNGYDGISGLRIKF
jgi:hypothetical protein